MAITTFALNGVPIETYGMRCTNAAGFLDLAKRTYNVVQPIQRDGQVAVSQASTTAPRMLKLQFYATPNPYTLAQRRVMLNALRANLRGLVAITTVEDPTKAVYGLLDSSAVSTQTRWMLYPDVTDEYTFICHDPLWYDVTPQVVFLPVVNTDYAIPIGSALMRRMRLVINGNWSGTVTATMKNGGGDTLQTMSSTFAASSAEYLDIENDPDRPHVWSYSGGVVTDRIGTLGATETFFLADPNDQPTLRVDKGTGAALYVYRAWEA